MTTETIISGLVFFAVIAAIIFVARKSRGGKPGGGSLPRDGGDKFEP